ncbi:stress-induced-phosphoprotein 1-like [Oppia nitens]|uniref:stress-induced-phosphoprotein 1-like n=1 Tax=Oppia nitens TaxID=1686743 RepID=UPI0023DB8AE5|nr:stress-induced-phosphoprotein 1-like [Oppia nitens]
MSDDNKQAALSAKTVGNEFYKKKQFAEAIEQYSKAIELDPNEMTYYLNRAAVHFELKEYDKCVKECETAVDIGRENRQDYKIIAKAYTRMANAYQKLDDLANAKTYYQKSLTEHRTPETLSKLSEIEKVLKEKERLAYIDPEVALQQKNLGNEFFKKGDYPNAIKHYSEAIKRNPEDAKLFSNRAACYQKLAEFQLAVKDSEQCIKLEPEFVKGHIRKGYALLACKEFSKAQTAFEKAMEIDKNNQEAMDGFKKCILSTGSNPEETRKRAMADPEVQQILGDPAMRMILEQMQTDPKAVQEHLKNPEIQSKIYKLMESGLIAIR